MTLWTAIEKDFRLNSLVYISHAYFWANFAVLINHLYFHLYLNEYQIMKKECRYSLLNLGFPPWMNDAVIAPIITVHSIVIFYCRFIRPERSVNGRPVFHVASAIPYRYHDFVWSRPSSYIGHSWRMSENRTKGDIVYYLRMSRCHLKFSNFTNLQVLFILSPVYFPVGTSWHNAVLICT